MNGPHDMGGMQCFGPVTPEKDEPIFHHAWERRALALTAAMGSTGSWNIDMSRRARESLAPAKYLSSSYYEIWIAALENLMKERGLVTDEDMAGSALSPAKSLARVPDGKMMAALLAARTPYEREAASEPLFNAGDAVRTRNINPQGHTRLPRYARGRDGVIERVAGCHVYPDSNALGLGEDPHWLYTVRFEASELFGREHRHTIMIDCWEPYLEAR